MDTAGGEKAEKYKMQAGARNLQTGSRDNCQIWLRTHRSCKVKHEVKVQTLLLLLSASNHGQYSELGIRKKVTLDFLITFDYIYLQ